MSDIEFPQGLMVKPPREGAPDFVKGSISIRRHELQEWLSSKEGEWINLDIKVSGKSGKWYAAVDNWKPEGGRKTAPISNAGVQGPKSEDFDDDIPFAPWPHIY